MSTIEQQTGVPEGGEHLGQYFHRTHKFKNGMTPADIEKLDPAIIEAHRRPTEGPDALPQHERSPHLRRIANPAPLGLFSFASTTLMLSLINVQANGVIVPNAVISLALGTGGLAQLLAGMWEFVTGNTFGATAFSSYGAFWISYAVLLLPSTGLTTAYKADTPAGDAELGHAIGFFLATWFIFTFCMLLASLRTTAMLVALFFFLDLTFLLLTIGSFVQNVHIDIAAGAFGIITAFIAYYSAASGVISSTTSYVHLPQGDLPKKWS